MKFSRFFKDKEGKWVLYQHPNLLLWLWILVQAISILVFQLEHKGIAALADMLLFAWSYSELTRGDSPFRRMLGGIIMAFLVIGLFV